MGAGEAGACRGSFKGLLCEHPDRSLPLSGLSLSQLASKTSVGPQSLCPGPVFIEPMIWHVTHPQFLSFLVRGNFSSSL